MNKTAKNQTKSLSSQISDATKGYLSPLSIIDIKFKGKRYLLIGSKKKGAIATPRQFHNFEESYAFLYADGVVSRHGAIIGTIDDIVFLEEDHE
jgi:hypothetical protein